MYYHLVLIDADRTVTGSQTAKTSCARHPPGPHPASTNPEGQTRTHEMSLPEQSCGSALNSVPSCRPPDGVPEMDTRTMMINASGLAAILCCRHLQYASSV